MSVTKGGLREFVQPQGHRRVKLQKPFETTEKCLSTSKVFVHRITSASTGSNEDTLRVYAIYSSTTTQHLITIRCIKTKYGQQQRLLKDNFNIVNLKSLTSGFFPLTSVNPYPTAFPYGNGMVLHFYQQQESSTTKTVHKVINKRLKTYV